MAQPHPATKSSLEKQLPHVAHPGDAREGPRYTSRQRFLSTNWENFNSSETITTQANVDYIYRFSPHYDTALDSGGVLIQGLQCSSATGTTTSFANGTEKVFYQMQIRIGGRVVYTRRLDLINTILFSFRVDDEQTIALQESVGKGIRADRITAASTAQDYFIPWSFFFDVDLFPINSLFGSKGPDFEVVIRMREAKMCMECASGTTPTYTFTGFKMVGDYVSGPHTNEVRSNGWSFFDVNYYRKEYQITSGDTTAEILLKPNKDTCTRMITIMRPKANVNVFASQDKEDIWIKDNLDSYNLTTDLGPVIPEAQITTNIVNLKHIYAEALSTWATHDEGRQHTWPPQFASNITWLDYSAQCTSGLYKFCITHDFRRSAEPQSISGEDFTNNRELRLKLNSTAGFSQNIQVDTFIEYIVPVVIYADGGNKGLADATSV